MSVRRAAANTRRQLPPPGRQGHPAAGAPVVSRARGPETGACASLGYLPSWGAGAGAVRGGIFRLRIIAAVSTAITTPSETQTGIL